MSAEATHGAPVAPGADPVERLLADLNPPQREAVTHGDGPLLVLAGAGSGKTRVLTHRIAWLLATGRARPLEILAITFTNKAANEMRERVSSLIGGISRAMWVMTFHSACARILRAEAPRLGYKRAFTIYDEADSVRMIKRCLEELELDPKRYPPRSVKAAISAAKNQLTDAADYATAATTDREQAIADTYNLYERRMVEASAMDFDDLLVRTVNLLELFADVREKYRRIFRWVLVDEYQDTNRAQYRMLQLLTEEHRNLTVVGDDFQCLVEGTEVTMADGSTKRIESLEVGDEVLSGHGPGDFRGAPVSGVYRAAEPRGIRITTAGGRELLSTRDHMHFAGYKTGVAPQMHLTYLMWKRGVGFRIGTSRVYTDGQVKPTIGLRTRCFSEYADAAWVISTHANEVDARFAEALLSLRYGLPTQPFMARRGRSAKQSVVADQGYLDRLFESIDSDAAARRLLADEGLSFDHPHHQAGTFLGRRRVLTLTICGERRGKTPMHRIAVTGRDADGRRALETSGLSVRPAKSGSTSWRHETCVRDFPDAVERVGDITLALDTAVRVVGRFGADRGGPSSSSSLPCIPAASVRPGMAVFTRDGGYDTVERVEEVELDRPVYDINVDGMHNFVANGIVTHNSVYSFRGADIRNILEFERDFGDATTVLLEQNYRSTQTILDAANGLIAHNESQKEKHLWTEGARGEPIVIGEFDDEHAEARYVASEINRLVEEGHSRDSIAVFYRMNAQSRVLEDTLVRFEIPYQVIGGTKFYERAEIKDAVAYLQLLANPADEISFGRVVNSPRRGIGQQTQARILSHANTIGADVLDVLAHPAQIPALGPAALKAVTRFSETIASLRQRAERAGPVADLLEATLHETGYLEALEAERTVEAEGRIENLEELVGVAGEFDANRELEGEGEMSPLEEFLAQISLVSEQDNIRDEESLATLMSLHNAKGLEYDAVFVIGCEEGVFPHSRSLEEGNIEEERRLAYVGVTRARERLWLTYAKRRALHGGELEPAVALSRRAARVADRAPRRDHLDGLGARGRRRPPPRDRVRRAPPRRGVRVASAQAAGAAAGSLRGRRRRRPRQLRRGGGDRGRARRGGRDPLRGRRHGAQADGRLRAAEASRVTARVIDGKAVAAEVRERVAAGVAEFGAAHGGEVPGLATVLVGDDPASHVYVGNKRKQTEQVGMRSIHHGLAADTSTEDLLGLVDALNRDGLVDGILVQLPLPPDVDQDAVISAIDAAKDVDGLTAASAGLLAQGRPGLVPCTPQGVVELLRHAGVELEGAEAVILGRSILVGRPLAALLLGEHATVTVCHSRTRDLTAVCSRADVLVAAVGSPRLVGAEMVKPGATVIDVGTNRTDEGLVGDVDFEAVSEVASALTPVPGGVGPMTIAMLLANTLRAALARRS